MAHTVVPSNGKYDQTHAVHRVYMPCVRVKEFASMGRRRQRCSQMSSSGPDFSTDWTSLSVQREEDVLHALGRKGRPRLRLTQSSFAWQTQSSWQTRLTNFTFGRTPKTEWLRVQRGIYLQPRIRPPITRPISPPICRSSTRLHVARKLHLPNTTMHRGEAVQTPRGTARLSLRSIATDPDAVGL